MVWNAELWEDCRCALAEGPLWDECAERLFWVDISGKAWYRRDADGTVTRFDAPDKVTALALCGDGRLLLTVGRGVFFGDAETGALTPFVCTEEDRPANRYNDAKVAPEGRFLVGSCTDVVSLKETTCGLYSVNGDGSWKRLLDGVGCSNGLAWSADGRTMYYVDTRTRGVQAFDYDPATGDIANGRFIIRLDKSMGLPDGMCIDAEGMLWVAQWGGHCVSRWNPQTGERIGRVDVPVERVSCCAFGGAALDELYITTAQPDAPNPDEPLAGSVFRAKVGVKGTPTNRFR